MKTMPKSYFERFRIIVVLILFDALAIAASFLASMWVKFDFKMNDVPMEYVNELFGLIWIWIPVCIAVFALLKLYNSILSFASTDILFRIFIGYAVLIALLVIAYNTGIINLELSYYVVGMFLSFLCTVGIHFGRRIVRELSNFISKTHAGGERVMVIGAGVSGKVVIRELS